MQQNPETTKIPILGITLGDPNGISYELLLRTFEDSKIFHFFIPVVYGSGKAIYYHKNLLKQQKFSYQNIQEIDQAQANRVNFIECGQGFERVEIGKPSKTAGIVAYNSLSRAVAHAQTNLISAIVTLPINKAAIQSDDFNFPGHTEYLTQAFQSTDSLMLMVYENLRIATVTGHIPLKQVSESININTILSKIQILHQSLRTDFWIDNPKIAVLGLNPHAGDSGLLGNEELEVIIPAIEKANQKNWLVFGPYSADGFFASGQYLKFDAILAMYHDQGLIPFKTIAQGNGVNFTAGIPVIRTSPDHGTAFNLAGKGVAKKDSFLNAIWLAIDILRKRTESNILYSNPLKTVLPVEVLQEDE
ncbi:MAG: 4-hydroxythreonine-4-phosphate dehydrogenase PdxA [Bacteroidia bacterium]|nr:4-hydroxythreonine-4-phosphate dehydrogenase PdxA [Bacteroidia bacterium]